MKYVTSIDGMRVEIHTDGDDVKTVLTTPLGRWIISSTVSIAFIKHEAFTGYMAQQVLNSYNERK